MNGGNGTKALVRDRKGRMVAGVARELPSTSALT